MTENASKGLPLFAKRRKHFPDPAGATMDGIVAMGDELSVETLFEAYSFGIFPWPHPDLPCLWFCPDDRGVLDFKDLHVSRSLEKFIRKTDYEITFNQAFSTVMAACAKVPRPNQSGTWITPEIERVYGEFHKLGYAHSVECWAHEEKELVGGLYGVFVGGVFSGESMFFKKSNASKLCLIRLVEQLQQNGLTWMDIQMVTNVTSQLGGKYIAKSEFLERVKAAKREARPLQLPTK